MPVVLLDDADFSEEHRFIDLQLQKPVWEAKTFFSAPGSLLELLKRSYYDVSKVIKFLSYMTVKVARYLF